ncbi:protein-export chaperone SecB [uncultured Haemophilus sp.]|jgi:preprotein translocase subunit secB|uniref:protein-export chaperone SecB n=1 Tax=uncultured Haemophilus sp. TaxID=237779 RepID=UPI0025F133A0|nr:protein-export chaperone SecB [uncultured Haemophilus sp.]
MMQFKLKESKIIKLLLTPTDEDNELSDSEDTLFDYTARKIDNRDFSIIFDFRYKHLENINLRLNYQVIFESDSDLPESLEGNKFIYINAPAIAYPFLRAAVANIFLQSGYSPIMLSSINFQRLGNKKIEKMQSVKSN